MAAVKKAPAKKAATKKRVAKKPTSSAASAVFSAAMRPRFEYMMVPMPFGELQPVLLNRYGAEGWHVVSHTGPQVLMERSV